MKNPCKHFILIKEYPNSKPLGAIEPYTTGEFSHYPEFWQPIYKYEIPEIIPNKKDAYDGEGKATHNKLFGSSGTGTTGFINEWSNPQLMQTIELQDCIELVYKQNYLMSNMSNNWGSLPSRVYKIVFSCIDGKWNKSEPIFGKIISPKDEYYEF